MHLIPCIVHGFARGGGGVYIDWCINLKVMIKWYMIVYGSSTPASI